MQTLSETIKRLALETGFSHCGIARAGYLEKEASHLEQWLKEGNQGEMHFMAENTDKRLDPSRLVEGALSVIVLLTPYAPPEEYVPKTSYRIARYALGKDYHTVVKEMMTILLSRIKEVAGEFSHRTFIDSAPVMERAWAVKAGLGWIGKNACFIVPGKGSWFLVSEIICDLDLEYDNPFSGHHCGACHRCMSQCPTGAIVSPKKINAVKCIAYLTNTFKGELPEALREKIYPWIYGCDICQEVCPHNQAKSLAGFSPLQPSPFLAELTKHEWENLSLRRFDELFRHSGIQKNTYRHFMRNIQYLKAGTQNGTNNV